MAVNTFPFVKDMGRDFIKAFICLITFWNFSVISGDEFLKSHFFKVVVACVCLFTLTCLVTLSRTCTLRKIPSAKHKVPSTLCDSDVESDDETGVVHEEVPGILDLPVLVFSFCHFRPMYGFVFVSSVLSLILIAVLNNLAYFSQDLVTQRDYFLSILVILNAIYPLMTLVSILALLPNLYTAEPTQKYYRPFAEFVQVPMNVFASRVFAILFCARFHVASCLLFQSSVVYGLYKVYHMSEAEIKRFKEDSEVESIHWVMMCMMVFMNITGFLLLLEGLLTACDVVRENLFFVCEKNWERNMRAIEYLLPQTYASTLEELKNALVEKSRGELTSDEERTVQYLSRPFWKTKRAFVDKPQEAPGRPKTPPAVNGSPRNPTKRSRSESANTPPDNGSPMMKFSPPLTRSRARLRKTSEPSDLSNVSYRG